MPIEQAIVTWLHLVSAAIWVGGGIFLGVVLAPVLKKLPVSVEERLELMIKIGRRFNLIAVPSLGILIATGIYNSHFFLTRPDLLLETSYGTYLTVKIVLVAVVVAAYAVHVKMIGGDMEEKILSGRLSEKQIQKIRKKIIVLGEVTTIASVAILFFAALLDAGV